MIFYNRLVNYFFFFIIFLLFLFFFLLIGKSFSFFQYFFTFFDSSFFNVNYLLRFDIISVGFMLLTCFIILSCLLFNWFLRYRLNLFNFLLWIFFFCLLNIFLCSDFFVFFFFFELIILPLFFLIGLWGSRSRRIFASYLFFLYTLFGSILILFAFILVFFATGSSNFEDLCSYPFFFNRFCILWFSLFLGCCFKLPCVPVHLWLPEAHVEAPAVGSVLLAGLILKIVAYVFIRFLIDFSFIFYLDFFFFIGIISFISLLYASLIALNQIDIKKIIAYSSIAHMNFALLGFFCYHCLGLSGAFFMMFGHGITSSALFLSIGILYDRYKTRVLFYYEGLATFMPLFSSFFFIFILSNFGFPGTCNFVGEFLISSGIVSISPNIFFFFLPALVLSLIFSLILFVRVVFGLAPFFLKFFSDITRLEFYILIIFLFFIVFFGFFPNVFFSFFQANLLVLI